MDIFGFINTIFGWPLGWIMWALYSFMPFWLALIVFTFVTKALMFPFSIKQQKSSAKMAYYQPQIAEIQKKFGNNRQKAQEETMKFYEKEKISMTAGCLPMLIQFPILFGVIDVVYKPLTHIIRASSEFINSAVATAGTLGVEITADYYTQLKLIPVIHENKDAFIGLTNDAPQIVDKIMNFDLQIFGVFDLGAIPQIVGGLYWLVPIIAAAAALFTGWLSMKINSANTPQQAGMGMMKGMILFMPIMSFFIAMGVPSAVGIYWIISNFAALLQTIILKKMYNPDKYKEQLAIEQAARKEQEKERNTIVIEQEVKKDGKVVVEKQAVTLSKKEAEKKAIADARKRMAEKYGETYSDETEN